MNTNYKHTIPQMTHPLSTGWSQPDTSKILVTDVRAVMKRNDFEDLAIYNFTLPNVYAGKMWKSFSDGFWWLNWFKDHQSIPNRCVINKRIIFIVG